MSNTPLPITAPTVTNELPHSNVEVLLPKTNDATTNKYNYLFSCQSCVDNMPANSSASHTFKQYWTMYTAQKDDSISTRLDNLFVNKKFSEVGKKLVTPSKLSLGKEVVRRHHYLNLPGKAPRTPNWSVDRSTKKLSLPEFALPMEEVSFIKEYLQSFIDIHEAIMKKNKELSKEEGGEISKSDKQRMRMWEAVFADKNRTHLMQMNNSHSKAQMDARNSLEKISTFYTVITKMYNDASWEPMSSRFGSMHDRLDTSICLKLIGEPIKVEVAKNGTVASRES